MKEYNLISDKKSNSNLPVKADAYSKFKSFFSFELSEKQEKVISDVKSFWTAELDFSELKNFLHSEFKIFKNKDAVLPDDNNKL